MIAVEVRIERSDDGRHCKMGLFHSRFFLCQTKPSLHFSSARRSRVGVDPLVILPEWQCSGLHITSMIRVFFLMAGNGDGRTYDDDGRAVSWGHTIDNPTEANQSVID